MNEIILLKLENISKTFPGTKALSSVSFNVRKGEIHAIVGENGAGKSTLSNIIAGVYKPDEGSRIWFDGKEINFESTLDSQKAGIAFVHQETTLLPALNVADNIYVSHLPATRLKFVDTKTLNKKAADILHKLGANFGPTDKLSMLNSANQQLVEIAKALSYDCKLIILDEPTSALSISDAKQLFGIVRGLKEKGISVLYISHRMSEIFELCDRLTVLRDGQFVKTLNVCDTNVDEVVSFMVGRSISNYYPEKSDSISDEIVFQCEDLSFEPDFKNISFVLHRGEILGFAGLVGSGRSEILRVVCGIDRKVSGRIYRNGEELQITSFSDAIDKGIAFLNEDRKTEGLFLDKSVRQNISVACIEHLRSGIFIDVRKESELSQSYVKKLNIKITDIQQDVNTLSGGNQQKVMIAKWLATKPGILILDEPTKGVDVGAKAEVHKLLRELANEGIGIIIISSELPEIIGLCDRAIVVYEHSIVREVTGGDINETTIMNYASGKMA